jgi:hypothetical protein
MSTDTAGMAASYDQRLTADELRGMLGVWGLSITPDSPLAGLPPSTGTPHAQTLRDRGLSDEPWGRALRALEHPHACFRTLIPLPDRTVVQAYYAGSDGGPGELIGCWPEPPRMRIRFPCATADLLRNSADLVLADLVTMADPFRADFTPAGLATLTAAADVLRHRFFESMLQRRCGTMPTTLSAAELKQAFVDGWRGQDARWLVTLFRVLMPASVPLPKDLEQQGLAELARAGLLEPSGHHWQATDQLCRLAAWWRTPLPALAHEVVALHRGRLRAYGYLIAVRGEGPLWVFGFWRDQAGQPGITLCSQSGPAFGRTLTSLYQTLEKTGVPDQDDIQPAPVTAPSKAPADRATGGADAVRADRPSAAFCTLCGTLRRVGARFCPGCGAALNNARAGGDSPS